MIIKGGSRSGRASYIAYLASHLLRADTNAVVNVLEVRGAVAADLLGAMREMSALGLCTGSRRPLYHANIDPSPDEPPLTNQQKIHALERLENELGFSGQPRIVVEHVKHGRPHLHAVWSRIDVEQGRVISDSHNFRRHEVVSRELEQTFGHRRIQGAHVGRGDLPRPDRRPSDVDRRQAERSGIPPEEATDLVSTLWHTADSGRAFVAAIEARGWVCARGDRRDYLLLDPAGETHSLARRVRGAKARDLRQRMAGVDPADLLSVQDARTAQVLARKLKPEEPAVEPPRANPGQTAAAAHEHAMQERRARAARARRSRVPDMFEAEALIARALGLPEITGTTAVSFLTREVERGRDQGEPIAGQVRRVRDELAQLHIRSTKVPDAPGWHFEVLPMFTLGLVLSKKTRADVARMLRTLRAARWACRTAEAERRQAQPQKAMLPPTPDKRAADSAADLLAAYVRRNQKRDKLVSTPRPAIPIPAALPPPLTPKAPPIVDPRPRPVDRSNRKSDAPKDAEAALLARAIEAGIASRNPPAAAPAAPAREPTSKVETTAKPPDSRQDIVKLSAKAPAGTVAARAMLREPVIWEKKGYAWFFMASLKKYELPATAEGEPGLGAALKNLGVTPEVKPIGSGRAGVFRVGISLEDLAAALGRLTQEDLDRWEKRLREATIDARKAYADYQRRLNEEKRLQGGPEL